MRIVRFAQIIEGHDDETGPVARLQHHARGRGELTAVDQLLDLADEAKAAPVYGANELLCRPVIP